MATFYYNRHSGESWESQWRKNLQNQSYVQEISQDIRQNGRDVSRAIQRQTSDIEHSIQAGTAEQVRAIQQSTDAICGTLNQGFAQMAEGLSEISYGIGEVKSELNDMGAMLDWNLSLLIEQQKTTNILLNNIGLLLRISDSQKVRQEYIEKGLRFMTKALFDHDLYQNAVDYFLEAERIEREDFFVLHRVGLIYLFSPQHLDIPKAETYFRNAARFAHAEARLNATGNPKILSGDLNKDLLTQLPGADFIRLQAAEAFLFAGRCCYIQGKFSESAELAGKGFALVPSLVEAGFMEAKALAADNRIREAVIALSRVINGDRYYAIKAATDLDLGPKREVLGLLEEYRLKSTEMAKQMLNDCKSAMLSDTVAINEIQRIEALVSKEKYIHNKRALDLMRLPKVRSFSEISGKSGKGIFAPQHGLDGFPKQFADCVLSLKTPQSALPEVKQLFQELSKRTQWQFPEVTDLSRPFELVNQARPHEVRAVLLDFLRREKQYAIELPNIQSQINETIGRIDIADRNRQSEFDSERNARRNAKSLELSVTYGLSFALAGFLAGRIISRRWGGYLMAVLGLVVGAYLGYQRGQKEG